MNFLDHYNDELRQLRDSGARFAREHPQVASALGLHPDAVTDPFVERLLEGVAYLSARVHRRLDRECAEFAQQALERICPLYTASTPAISTFAFHPDVSSPDAFRGNTLPRGSLVAAYLPGRKQPVMFSTARSVTLLPLRLGSVECSRGITGVPLLLSQRLASSAAVLRFRFELEGGASVADLSREREGFAPLHLSLAGDLPRAYALHRALLADTTAWFALVSTNRGDEVLTLPMSGIRLSGVDAADALLPETFGGLPGLRLLREYFAQPTHLLGVYLDALAAIAAKAPTARAFELFFALHGAPGDLIGDVDASQFRLFATPAINLYSKRFDPVPYDANQPEQWIPVDRMRPAAHHLWALSEVSVCERSGRAHRARSVLETAGCDGEASAIRYGMRREETLPGGGARPERPDPLASHDLIAISVADDALEPDDIATITGRALVADRDWRPGALLDAELQLLDPAAVRRVECLWPASAPRARPGIEACWEAVSHIGRNPLALRAPQRQDVTTRIVELLLLASDAHGTLDRQRLDSLRSVELHSRFVAAGRTVPTALVRATHVEIDIAQALHADRGGWLFGRLLAQALAESATLNDGVEIVVRLDGEAISTHVNTATSDGTLQ
ncbi:type VI secretion system baseplate subunit TssF [Paraburkholderia sprentiae WSM5005]|uniref:Type VI secretion system baseplate subunit TssF n=1 Tax=Paraburkholderia sprentiae WSM5005 TaxID=754502 RepID=A0A1L1P7F2_9BURK|nr:type VI secretion system baseplate subunit TssF [Paraburkholderia sprentiae]APA88721.1 type VI secretion system baseplate subunit TssF [Paraburkholderia sprentiae WSM5005]